MKTLVAALALFVALPLHAQIKVGMIGLDTSHVIAFAKVLNDPSNPQHVPGAKVVAAYKGGSPDLPNSRDRIEGYTKQLQEDFGVEIVPDIATLCSKVDAILLESVDGRVHLAQAREVFKSKKPVFIDKPLAASLADAREIARLAKESGTPWWSASSLRYSGAARELSKVAGLHGALTWGPAPIQETHELDMSWYGIHPIEMLYAIMGPGCERVRRTYTDGADVIVGEWSGGRLGTVRTIRDGKTDYGAIAFGDKEVKISTEAGASYSDLLGLIVQFFKDGKPPVAHAETLEIFAFMDAALRSKQQNGAAVALK